MMLQRNIIKLILGVSLLGHGTNLLIFTAAGLTRSWPPIIAKTATAANENLADPLPQALILTAIVIGFALTAFILVLFQRAYTVLGTSDTDDMRATDR